MAFHIVTGVMGAGKSYMGAELIMTCLREGGTVSTNMPLNWDVVLEQGWESRIIQLPPHASDMVRMVPGEKLPNGTQAKPTLESDYLRAGSEGAENLVVLDEASLEFDIDTQLKDRDKNKPIFQLVALCRHAGLDLYFLAQSAQNVDAKLRRMAETRIRCVKTERIPFLGWLLAMLPGFGTFMRVHYQGQDTLPCGKTWHSFDQATGDFYDTHGMRGGMNIQQAEQKRLKGMGATEKKGKSAAFGVLLLMLGLLSYVVINGNAVYGRITGTKEPTKAAQGPATSALSGGAKGEVITASTEGVTPQKEKEDEPLVLRWDMKMMAKTGPRFTLDDGTQLRMGAEYGDSWVTSIMAKGRSFLIGMADGTVYTLRAKTAAETNARRPKPPEKQTGISIFPQTPVHFK